MAMSMFDIKEKPKLVQRAFLIGAYCMWNTFSGLLASFVCQSQVSNNAYVEPISILLTIFSRI